MVDFCASGAHALLCAARRFSKSTIFAAFLFANLEFLQKIRMVYRLFGAVSQGEFYAASFMVLLAVLVIQPPPRTRSSL